MNIINYFAEMQLLKLILRKYVDTVKIVKNVEDFTPWNLNSKNIFSHLTNILNIGILEIQNLIKPIKNLKLDLLESQNLECKMTNSLIMISRRTFELFLCISRTQLTIQILLMQ